ncbi:hypothetical protein K431DRAFT_342359 [Polychaeton citri CBS 116435]|uniref:Aminoglycoside phosphotransferase domain-containing protein n=1 Tax=Polychaeton citri CBS 116435 TaxID=1314669 RepID=A0A9P4URX2_9PEZI|nr:hypothetical protein K431DRAFT_342359 [Polychaeton citri CBS 116435]
MSDTLTTSAGLALLTPQPTGDTGFAGTLQVEAWQWQLLESLYPNANLRLCSDQGGCSLTVIVSACPTSAESDRSGFFDRSLCGRFVVQLRRECFKLDLSMVVAARTVYGSIVPVTIEKAILPVRSTEASVQVVEMELVDGVRLDRILASAQADENTVKLRRVIEGLADIFATAWRRGQVGRQDQHTGRIGSTILPRLMELGRELPSLALRSAAVSARRTLEDGMLEPLPVTVQHGDLLPSNIVIDPTTWRVQGLLDWVEAEYLPWGINLYGLEHLLGECVSTIEEGRQKCRFVYQGQADALRRHFWFHLLAQLPHSAQQPAVLDAVLSARTIGVLLWHGFAWDDGRIDRVVNEKDDMREVALLKAFLGISHDSSIFSDGRKP